MNNNNKNHNSSTLTIIPRDRCCSCYSIPLTLPFKRSPCSSSSSSLRTGDDDDLSCTPLHGHCFPPHLCPEFNSIQLNLGETQENKIGLSQNYPRFLISIVFLHCLGQPTTNRPNDPSPAFIISRRYNLICPNSQLADWPVEINCVSSYTPSQIT